MHGSKDRSRSEKASGSFQLHDILEKAKRRRQEQTGGRQGLGAAGGQRSEDRRFLGWQKRAVSPQGCSHVVTHVSSHTEGEPARNCRGRVTVRAAPLGLRL